MKPLLLLGDFVCFLIFAALGLRSHEDGVSVDSVLRVVVPFEVGWLIFSLITQLWRPQPQHSPRYAVVTWVPAWIVGLGLRSAVFGREFAPTFAVIALLFNGGLLLLWRCVVSPRLLREEARIETAQ